MNDQFITILQEKLASLNREKIQKQEGIKQLLSDIDLIQKSVTNIVELLTAEGVLLDEEIREEANQKSVSDLAYFYLNSTSEKKPLYYKAICEGILASGKPLPGKNPAANLLTHISRDKRFVRVSSGTYALSEWGIPVVIPVKRKKSRKLNHKKEKNI